MRFLRLFLIESYFALSFTAIGQQTAGPLLTKALRSNVLSTSDQSPFHAVLDIEPDPKTPSDAKGRIEIFWAAPDRYVIDVHSQIFDQHRVVDGSNVKESDNGDYEPVWLEYFVRAVLDPFDRAAEILQHPNAFGDQAMFADSCYEWDGRRNVVLNAENDAKICFSKLDPITVYTLDYTHYLSLTMFAPFHDKQIAREYTVSLRGDAYILGHLRTLEDWKPDAATFAVKTATPLSQRVDTVMLSASDGAARIVSKPEHVNWPIIREGPTEGNALVHVVTDRSGHVREAATPESDNEELKAAAASVAMQYVFTPLVRDGLPVQMEIPLVVHFQTPPRNPLKEFGDAETRKRISGCRVPKEIPDPASAGRTIQLNMLISEKGKIITIGGSDHKVFPPTLFSMLAGCRFEIYRESGNAVQYRANLDVVAK